MSEKTTTLAPGTFCWPELSTSDQAAAEAFYAKLFGWSVDPIPMGPDMHYTMFKQDGRDTGGAAALMPEQKAQGVSPHWNSYVSVVSADDASKRIKTLGGQVIMEPMDVMDKGRMLVAMDPTGAVFCCWQAMTHQGAGVLDEIGGLTWTELTAKGVDKAIAFYTQLFGWTTKTMPLPMGTGNYTVFQRGETPAGGAMESPQEMAGAPSCWTPYFSVKNVDESAKLVTSLGGKVLLEPHDVPGVGRFSIVADPQGAVFAIAKFVPPAA